VTYRNLIVTLEDRLAVVVVNRPDVRNALDGDTTAELHRALDEIHTAGVSVFILTGAGDRAFVSGADINAIRARRQGDALAGINSRLFSAIEAHDAVSIAAVNGYALGGGCEMALACDLRIASVQAVFGLPETGIGIIPGAGGTQRLTRTVGKYVAMELVLTGRRVKADEAKAIGLVAQVYPAASWLEDAKALARTIAEKPPIAIRLATEAIDLALNSSLDAGLEFERKAFYLLFATEDKKEGVDAFVNKRKAVFKGR
jgi:enoyl-CoA hydratase/carnithine racemase